MATDGRSKLYPKMLNGNAQITNAEADNLFSTDLKQAKAQAARDFSNFGKTPNIVQKGLSDMEYNLGSLKRWKHLRAAVDKSDWREAGKQVLDSHYAHQLPKRADDNAGLMFYAFTKPATTQPGSKAKPKSTGCPN